MAPTVTRENKKLFIGLALRTNNMTCGTDMPAHKDRFFSENVLAKIPNKANGTILALYTDYEGDHTKPYTWILGCEVSSLDNVPAGLVAKTIPAASYEVYTTEGAFPQGLIAAWQAIWQSPTPRAYTCDYEVYPADFDPQHNPQVKVYIAVQ